MACHVSKPWGEMQSYDFIVGRPHGFASVQVKSTTTELGTGYACVVRGGHKPYAGGSFDFLAAYVVFEDVWYIIPAEKIQGKGCVALYPKSKKSKYEKYREAWKLLREAPEFTGDIQACAEEFPVRDFLPLFQRFPQTIPVLHSLCTTGHEFSLADVL